MRQRSFYRLGLFAATAVLMGLIGLGCSTGATVHLPAAPARPAAPAARALGSAPATRDQSAATAWRSVPAPDPHHDAALFDIACTSKVACTTVGEAHVGRGHVVVKGSVDTAIGRAETAKFHGYAIAERWNGVRWQLQQLPAVARTEFVELTSVACPSLHRCVAVGDAASSRTFLDRPVAATWNGSKWRWMALPALTRPLTAVTCSSATSCSAVGPDNINLVFSGRVHIQPSAIAWNGRTWRTIHLALPPVRTVPVLDAMSCRSARSCLAVGAWISEAKSAMTHPGRAAAATGSVSEHVLVESWNGRRWQRQPTPAITSATAINLVDVTCPTAGHCVAVGDITTTTNRTEPLIITGTGARWRLQKASPTTQQAFLSAVACDAGGCTAVGATKVGQKGASTLAEALTPSGWQLQPTPVVRNSKRELLGVACARSGLCLAVGAGSAGALVEQT